KSGKSKADILSLLKDGEDHYYTGEEAVAEGFADAVTSDDDGNDEPDENARAYANQLLERISARGAPAKYAGVVVTAALRGAPRKPAAAPAPAGEGDERLTVSVDAGAVREAVATALAELNPPPASGVHTPPADAGTSNPEEPTMDPKAVLAADRQRRDNIRNQFAPFSARADLDTAAIAVLQRECEDDTDCTPEAAGQRLLALLGRDTTPTGGMRAEPGNQDETATYREGAIHATLNRKDPQNFKHDEKSAPFRGMNLADLGRDCLERAGKKTRGLSKQEIAVQALQSTSDF